jgi:hypothetical protein
MANVSFRWKTLTATLLALAGAGCDAQVRPGYTGEVQFSLQGSVELAPDTTLVPAFAFEKREGQTVYGPEAVEVVDGQLSGVFPSKFRLDMSSPPPDATLSPFMGAVLGGQGSAAYGIIVMLPANHPQQIPRAKVEEAMGPPSSPALLPTGELDPNWVPTDPSLVGRTFTNCASDGHCRVRKTRCSQSPCELYASAGTAPDPAALDATTGGGGGCGPGLPYCYGSTSVCSLAGCHQDFYQCDLDNLGPYDQANGEHFTLCQLTEESGDVSLLAIQDLRTVATEYAILFSTVEISQSPVGDVKRGYNLMRLASPSRADWVAIRTCWDNAEIEARRLINTTRGASWALNDLLPTDAAAEEQKTLQGLLKACPSLPVGQVVENIPITIKLGRPPFPF